ncbi:MAG: hypothetical protein N3A66_05040 [Planctomycetota bacterium]|nr:hypothetical protein [Planctomycetota bacterium]
MDAAIAALRNRLAAEDARIAQAKRSLERKQIEQRVWQERLERYRANRQENLVRMALARKRDMDEEVKALEFSWWTALQKREGLQEEMRKLEEQVQEARRHKESLVVRARQGRSSTDFTPLPPAKESEGAASDAVENELRRLKAKSCGSRP